MTSEFCVLLCVSTCDTIHVLVLLALNIFAFHVSFIHFSIYRCDRAEWQGKENPRNKNDLDLENLYICQ